MLRLRITQAYLYAHESCVNTHLSLEFIKKKQMKKNSPIVCDSLMPIQNKPIRLCFLFERRNTRALIIIADPRQHTVYYTYISHTHARTPAPDVK